MVAAVGGCKKPDEPEAKVVPQNVSVTTIKPVAELPDIIRLPGVTQPNRVVRVAAEVAGRIEELLVDEGDTIIRGGKNGAIARLNTDLLQAAYDRYQAEAEFNERDYERLASAHKKGVATQMEVDQARMRADSNKALAASAKAELERSVIKAPIDGFINKLPVEVGEYLQPGTLVAEIVDFDTIKVVVDVPERDVGFLTDGDHVVIIANHRYSDREHHGTITYISQLAEDTTFTSRIEVSIPNPDRQLRTGQIVDVRLTRQVIPNAIVIPLGAVIPRENDYVAYVVNDGKARRREIRIGVIQGHTVQILSGLSAGDQLIVDGQRYVADGQDVAIRSPIGSSAASQPAAKGVRTDVGHVNVLDTAEEGAAP